MSRVIKSVKENKSILTIAEMKLVIIMKNTVTHIVIISEIFGGIQKHFYPRILIFIRKYLQQQYL